MSKVFHLTQIFDNVSNQVFTNHPKIVIKSEENGVAGEGAFDVPGRGLNLGGFRVVGFDPELEFGNSGEAVHHLVADTVVVVVVEEPVLLECKRVGAVFEPSHLQLVLEVHEPGVHHRQGAHLHLDQPDERQIHFIFSVGEYIED